MGGSRLVDQNLFDPSSIEGQIYLFASNNNLVSDMRMKHFLKKYDEYRNGILKIEKPIEDFSNLEMSNVRGFEDPVEQRKAIQSLERKERRENNLAQNRERIRNGNQQNEVFANSEMSFRSKTYDDAAKQAKYDRGLTRFDELIQTPEGLNRLKNMYATNAANAKSREYYGDPNLPFAEQGQPGKRQPFPLSELAEEWDTIVAKPKNQWFHAFNDKKAVGFEFNPKMLDPEYAAWKGATRGTRIYRGDFNNDGYEDIIELDEDDEFRTINGYSKRPSKQALYDAYFKENEATANEFGKPVYPMKFKDWKQEKAAKMDADERKKIEHKSCKDWYG